MIESLSRAHVHSQLHEQIRLREQPRSLGCDWLIRKSIPSKVVSSYVSSWSCCVSVSGPDPRPRASSINAFGGLISQASKVASM